MVPAAIAAATVGAAGAMVGGTGGGRETTGLREPKARVTGIPSVIVWPTPLQVAGVTVQTGRMPGAGGPAAQNRTSSVGGTEGGKVCVTNSAKPASCTMFVGWPKASLVMTSCAERGA